MAPASSSKLARAAGPASNGSSKSPAVQPAQTAPKAGTSSSPNANANTHTTAQLLPVVTTTIGNEDEPYAGMPQPDEIEAQQLSGQQYKDGRIRNPVPSKLKGKTSASSGRFSVMHMDIRGKDMVADRDLAAKRTSENTAMAAQKAFESGYQPHRKSNWMRVSEEQADPSVPFTGTTPYNHALYGLKPVANPSKETSSTVEAPRPLIPEEVKEEQARLLTLLRTLQPLTVVDQLCKALAYFGGIPDAPPPKERNFPESAEANGSGAVFVGWVAEIFPDLDAQGRRKQRPFVAPSLPPAQSTEKRGRGRPKGSKASKVRRDKGIKKGSKKTPLIGALEANTNEAGQDNSWVDVEDTILDDDDDEDEDVNMTGAHIRHTPERLPEPPSVINVEATASAKKRGRPKGSKNRPKGGTAEDFTPNPAPVSALFSIGKKSGGRGVGPKGVAKPRPSKDSAAPANLAAATANAAAPVATAELQSSSQAAAPTDTAQAGDEYSLAALKAFNEEHSNEVAPHASSFHPVNPVQSPGVSQVAAAKPTPAKGSGKVPPKKRKRNPKELEPAAQPATGIAPAVPDPTVGVTQPGVSGASSTVDLTAGVSPDPPAPKRQRKTKAKAPTAAASTPVVYQSIAGGPSQASQPPVRSVPTPATQSTDTEMYTGPTIEELEAQLDQHDAQSPPPAYTEFSSSRSTSRTKAPPQPIPPQPQPQVKKFQSQAASNPNQAHQSSKAEPQRTAARQKQQYQQQPAARTASPNITQVNTASQSASPSMNAAQSASPNLHQQRTSNAQTPTSMNQQVQNQTSRSAQSYYPQQTTSSAPSYGQQPNAQYPSPQPAKQQFTLPQSQQQQSYSTAQQPSQQQPTYISHQPQYTHQKHQSYSAQPQQSYTSPQQQYSSQRLQQSQYTTTSSGSTPQSLPAQSPQYGASSASDYSSGDGNFRTTSNTGMNFNSTSYGSNQTSNASRSHNVYSNSATSSYSNPNQPASSYSAASSSRRNLPATTGNHTSVQNVQSLPQNLGGFSTDFGSLGFGDNLMSSLDNTTGSHNNLGMNAASYNMGAGNVSRSSTGANSFGFDSTIRNDGSPYFGSLRR